MANSIKALRRDRGGEYNSIMFEKFCKGGVIHEVIAPYTLQHNWIANRRNRTILDMVRNFFKIKNTPNKFWGEAVNCVVYILNRCSTKMNKTPKKLWTWRKPLINHLRVFGSLCFMHVPGGRWKKLDGRSDKLISISYHSTKSFMLFESINNNV